MLCTKKKTQRNDITSVPLTLGSISDLQRIVKSHEECGKGRWKYIKNSSESSTEDEDDQDVATNTKQVW